MNVIGSNSANAAMAAARAARAPIIIQISHSGSQFFAGKTLDNGQHQASIAGAIAGAHHVRTLASVYGVPVVLHTDHCAKKLLPWLDGVIEADEAYHRQHGEPLFSTHMIDLSEQPLSENLEISARYMARLARMGVTLELEIGITGGEEDGVDNRGVTDERLYTNPEDVLSVYDALSPIGRFNLAAAFGNTHGVYAPGNVKLRPTILRDAQRLVQERRKTGPKPINFVFHGGSASTRAEIAEAVSYGVVKMNIDTDTQWAFTHPIKTFMDQRARTSCPRSAIPKARTGRTRSTSIRGAGSTSASRESRPAFSPLTTIWARATASSSSARLHGLQLTRLRTTSPGAEERGLEESRCHESTGSAGARTSASGPGSRCANYSPGGIAWDDLPHHHARSRAYRWNEDGIAGISDRHQTLCFVVALWNGVDPVLKERLFGLNGQKGNHGEDCKELYWYLDTPPPTLCGCSTRIRKRMGA